MLAGCLVMITLGASLAAWFGPAHSSVKFLWTLLSGGVCLAVWRRPHASLLAGQLLLTVNGNALLRLGKGAMQRGRLLKRNWSGRHLLSLTLRLENNKKVAVLVVRRGQAGEYRRLRCWCRHLDSD